MFERLKQYPVSDLLQKAGDGALIGAVTSPIYAKVYSNFVGTAYRPFAAFRSNVGVYTKFMVGTELGIRALQHTLERRGSPPTPREEVAIPYISAFGVAVLSAQHWEPQALRAYDQDIRPLKERMTQLPLRSVPHRVYMTVLMSGASLLNTTFSVGGLFTIGPGIRDRLLRLGVSDNNALTISSFSSGAIVAVATNGIQHWKLHNQVAMNHQKPLLGPVVFLKQVGVAGLVQGLGLRVLVKSVASLLSQASSLWWPLVLGKSE